MVFTGDIFNFKVTDPTGLQATIDWGDGQTSTGTIRFDEDERSIVSGSYTHAKAGSFSVQASFTRNGSKVATSYSWAEVASVHVPTVHFVNQLYRDLLHREADNGGLAN